MKSVITELFPHDSFREKQQQVIKASLNALYDQGYDNVILQAPTGTGKSPILTTLLRYAADGFYTTPQKSLREQVRNDEALKPHVASLKAREDTYCSIGNSNSKECHVNKDSESSCSDFGSKCNYWGSKMNAIGSPIAVITFSYLIIDNMLPVRANGTPVSFDDREMVAVDEAHGLIQQTESLHAGESITPYGLPRSVFTGATRNASLDANNYGDVEDSVDIIYKRAKEYVDEIPVFEMSPQEQRCVRLVDKIDWIRDEVDRGNSWVADVEREKYGNNYVKIIDLTPTNVASYLKNNVWSRADKRVISTATLPYQSNPEVWLHKVGLDPDNTKVIDVSMTFPVENRPIYTHTTVVSMSSGGDKENWSAIMEQLNNITEKHYNQKGVVHTASYSRASTIADSINRDEHPYLDKNVYVHNGDRDADKQMDEWQDSDKDLFLSPSVMEGVDLKDDQARWQVLLKVPYPPKSSRIEHMLNEEKYGWAEYKERTLLRVVQSYGRAVRSKDDYASYYVLDEDFNDLVSERNPPPWFMEAITDEEPDDKGVFDY